MIDFSMLCFCRNRSAVTCWIGWPDILMKLPHLWRCIEAAKYQSSGSVGPCAGRLCVLSPGDYQQSENPVSIQESQNFSAGLARTPRCFPKADSVSSSQRASRREQRTRASRLRYEVLRRLNHHLISSTSFSVNFSATDEFVGCLT